MSDTEYIMIMNPDIVVGPRTLLNLLAPFQGEQGSKVAMTEARQTPVEHPKAYDPKTLETAWASTACTIIRRKCFDEVQGFDAETFFMYCDDLDFSWRLRLNGYKLIYCPDAVVFHDKSIDHHGRWQTTKAERRFSAEASILLAHKWVQAPPAGPDHPQLRGRGRARRTVRRGELSQACPGGTAAQAH